MYNTPLQPASVDTPKKSNRNTIIAIVVIVVLCCCCCAVLVGARGMLQPLINGVFSSVNQQLSLTPYPANMPTPESGMPTTNPAMPTGVVPSNVIPQGGLGDDTQRAEAWSYVIASAAMNSCIVTDPSKASIEVTQKPDSTGMWMEKWTLTCPDNSKAAYDVTFTPGQAGSTDVKVAPSK